MTTIQQINTKTRLAVLAMNLGQLYQNRAQAATNIESTEADIAARIVELTPITGWPGKNDNERDAAKFHTLGGDDLLDWLRATLRDHKTDHASIQASIDGLEAERRAIEWSIRADMMQAIGGRVDKAADGGPAWDEAADDEAYEVAAQAKHEDEEADDEAYEVAAQAKHEDEEADDEAYEVAAQAKHEDEEALYG